MRGLAVVVRERLDGARMTEHPRLAGESAVTAASTMRSNAFVAAVLARSTDSMGIAASRSPRSRGAARTIATASFTNDSPSRPSTSFIVATSVVDASSSPASSASFSSLRRPISPARSGTRLSSSSRRRSKTFSSAASASFGPRFPLKSSRSPSAQTSFGGGPERRATSTRAGSAAAVERFRHGGSVSTRGRPMARRA